MRKIGGYFSLFVFLTIATTATTTHAYYYEDPIHVINIGTDADCLNCHGEPDWMTPSTALPHMLRNDSSAPLNIPGDDPGTPEPCSDCHNQNGATPIDFVGLARSELEVMAHTNINQIVIIKECWKCHENHDAASFNLSKVQDILAICSDTRGIECSTDADCPGIETCGVPLNYTNPATDQANNDGLGPPDPYSEPPNSGNMDSTPDGVCQVCHTDPNTGHWRADGSGADHYNGYVCTDCHEHIEGFKPGCGGCHGEPPVIYPDDLDQSTRATGSQTVGMHEIHASGGTNYFFGCSTCHVDGNGSEVPTHPGGPIQIGFNISYDNGSGEQFYDGTGTTYVGQDTVWAINGYQGTNGTIVLPGGQILNASLTCSTIYCHSTGQAILWDATPISVTPSPPWDGIVDPDGIKCNNCHQEKITNDLHNEHVNVRKFDCDYCHAATVSNEPYPYAGSARPTIIDKTKHADGRFTVIPSDVYDAKGAFGLTENNFTYSPAPNGGTCTFPSPGTYNGSDQFTANSCHDLFGKGVSIVGSQRIVSPLTWQTFPPPNYCGNGVSEPGEACDDGNLNDYDACSNLCVVQTIPGPGPCNDSDNDGYISIADIGNGCYIAGTPETIPPYDECDNNATILLATTYYEDLDGDGYGSSNAQTFCNDPGSGWSLVNSDCADLVDGVDGIPGNADDGANINPGQAEIPGNGLDDNCDGLIDIVPAYYLPRLDDGFGPGATGWMGWTDSVSIQNACGEISASVDIFLYDDFGATMASDLGRVITPCGKWEFRPWDYLAVPFRGSIEIVSDKAVSVANTANFYLANAYAIYNAVTDTKPIMSFPKVYAGFDNGAWTNTVYVFNPDVVPHAITVNKYDVDATPQGNTTYLIPPKGRYVTDVLSLTNPPLADVIGSLVVTSDDGYPLAGVYDYNYQNDGYTVYEATGPADTHVFPWVNDGFGPGATGWMGWTDSISIQNADPALSATVDIYLYTNAGGAAVATDTQTISPLGKYEFRPWDYMAAPFEGSIKVVTQDNPVVAMLTSNYYLANAYAIYDSIKAVDFKSQMTFAKVYAGFGGGGWTNLTHVTNPDTVAHNVEFWKYDVDGSIQNPGGVPYIVTIPGNGTTRVSPLDPNMCPPGVTEIVGTVVVRVQGGTPEPMAGVHSYNYQNDGATTYPASD